MRFDTLTNQKVRDAAKKLQERSTSIDKGLDHDRDGFGCEEDSPGCVRCSGPAPCVNAGTITPMRSARRPMTMPPTPTPISAAMYG